MNRPTRRGSGTSRPILKARCVKCHGPAKREGRLNLASPKGLARGGKKGGLVVAGRPEASLIWERVAVDEMPPDEPLPDEEKILLRRWIERGAPGLPSVAANESEAADHWSFAPPRRPEPPKVFDSRLVHNEIDRFLQAALEAEGLSIGIEADRYTLIRRVAVRPDRPAADRPSRSPGFATTVPPDAYERMVERYLASSLPATASVGASSGSTPRATPTPTATSTPTPIALWPTVIAITSSDAGMKTDPLDRFVRDQIAGDELAGYRPGKPPDPSMIEGLIATHFLRNAPDGTGESDGNPDELRADRYAVLEGTTQVIGSSLLGLTFQCAPLSRPQIRTDLAEGLLRSLRHHRPGLQRQGLGESGQPRRRRVPPEPAELAAWQERSRRADAELETLALEHAFKNPFERAGQGDPQGHRQGGQGSQGETGRSAGEAFVDRRARHDAAGRPHPQARAVWRPRPRGRAGAAIGPG